MRRGLLCLTIVVAFLLTVLVFSGHARAADPHAAGGEGDAAAKAGDHGGGEGKPRDSLTEKAFDLTLWTVFVFVGLLLVLRVYAWKPMLEGLQKREHAIESAIEQAKKDQEEAAALRAELEQELAKLHDQERVVMEQAHRDGQATKDRMIAEAEAEIQAKRERADRDLENEREQALRDLREQTVELATLVSAKAIRRSMTLDDHRRLVDEAVAELDFTAQGASKA